MISRDGFQFDMGLWTFGCFWRPRDWVLLVVPTHRIHRGAWRDGTAVCIGPFRVVKYPSE